MSNIVIKVSMDKALQDKLSEINNSRTMLAIHNQLAKMCDPYVPMREGALAQTVQISPTGVRYTQPYARYQYYGQVYGPNIPIIENGQIVGWFSPPGQKKHPTGQYMTHSTEMHPLASSFWDKAMLRDHREEFEQYIKEILRWRLMESER